MANPQRTRRVVSTVWSIVIAVGVIALAGSIMLPSTKRARLDFRQQPYTQPGDGESTATSRPATQP
jgi:hypothetical protein